MPSKKTATGSPSSTVHSSPGHHDHRPPRLPAFSAALMEENISTAEPIIDQWDRYPSHHRTASLFHAGRSELRRYLRAVAGLQRAMVFFYGEGAHGFHVTPGDRAYLLVHAKKLIQAAMRRLEYELRLLLAGLGDHLDFDFSDDGDGSSSDDEAGGPTVADLRAVAGAMVAAGYTKECVRVYKAHRRTAVDDGLRRLGFKELSPSQAQKLEWEEMEVQIRSWLAAAPVAVRTLFAGERALADYVFAGGNDAIRESCFSVATRDAATHFLAIPESVARWKRSPEKLFRVLDLYGAVADLLPEVESVFAFNSTAGVRNQATNAMAKLAEAARSHLSDFEAAIQKDASKSPFPSGGVHPLTRYVMNYLAFLADYEPALTKIFAEFPFQVPKHLPESIFDALPSTAAGENGISGVAGSPVGLRIAWLEVVLLCKLDAKAELYKEAALSYLFLANNLQYMVNKVEGSGLRVLLGEEWVMRNSEKARLYAANYVRMGWGKVAAAAPAAEAEEGVRRFQAAVEAAVRAQAGWVVADARMREEVRSAVAATVVPPYQEFCNRWSPAAILPPEEVSRRLAGLFSGSITGVFDQPVQGMELGQIEV